MPRRFEAQHEGDRGEGGGGGGGGRLRFKITRTEMKIY